MANHVHSRKLKKGLAVDYERQLRPPGLTSPVHVVIDTDCANEIDDQFALAWALLRPDRLKIHGIYACPFSFAHRRALFPNADSEALPFNPPNIGMQRSFDEILKVKALITNRLVIDDVPVFRGSDAYLTSLAQPIDSDAVQHLIATAKAMPDNEPLYVLAIGCATNVASALLIAPEIAQKIVVVWTSGYPSHAPHINRSFNLEQDVLASQWLFDSKVPLVYLPGYHVGAQLRLSLAEVERYIRPCGPLGSYLHGLFVDNPLWSIVGRPNATAHSWVIWDLINVAWLINPEWVASEMVDAPRLDDALRWQARSPAHPMREAYAVQRDAIVNDLFSCFSRLAV